MAEEQQTEDSNLQLFREILSDPIVQKCSSVATKQKYKARKAKAGRKTAIKPVIQPVDAKEEDRNDAEELGEFIDVTTLCSIVAISADLTKVSRNRDFWLSAYRVEGAHILDMAQYTTFPVKIYSANLEYFAHLQHIATHHSRDLADIFPACRVSDDS